MKKKKAIEMLLEFSNLEENSFKATAYRKAANSLKDYYGKKPTTIKEWTDIPFIGKSIASKLLEYYEKGSVKKLKTIKKNTVDLSVFSNIPGIGKKKAELIYKNYKVKSLDKLFALLERGKIKEDYLARGLKTLKLRGESKKISFQEGVSLFNYAKKRLMRFSFVIDVIPAGSLRRFKATVKDIDTIVVVNKSVTRKEAVARIAKKFKTEGSGDAKCYIPVGQGRFVDLYVSHEKNLGNMMLYLTGSSSWGCWIRSVVKKKGGKLNQYYLELDGKKRSYKNEDTIIKKILGYTVPPECREKAGDMPKDLVTMKDIKGDYHIHTTKSDGKATLREVANTLKEKGYKWFGIADHIGNWQARGDLSETELLKWIKTFNKNKHKLPIKGYIGGEVDIFKDKLSCSIDTIKKLDFVVLSVHLQAGKDLERKYCNAMESLKDWDGVKILGHPIGRNISKGINMEWGETNWMKIFLKAKECGFALEINSTMDRLDLDWTLIRYAKQVGCKFSIGSDAHNLKMLDVHAGLMMARKGLLNKNQLLYCEV
jgi:DNA polymerase (family 10)